MAKESVIQTPTAEDLVWLDNRLITAQENIAMFWKRIVWPVLTLVVVILFVGLIPSVLLVSSKKDSDTQEFARSLERLVANFGPDMLTYGILMLLASVLSVAIYHGIILKREHGQLIQPIRDPRVRRNLVWGGLVCIVITLSIIYITASETNTDIWVRLANNPGGWFAIITGILSVVGVYLTLANILDVRNSIISFADFIYRVEDLIQETEPGDYIRMMLHTPAPGCLVLHPTIWRRLAKKLDSCDKTISLTCLSQSEMKNWFQQYEKDLSGDRLNKMRTRIEEGLTESDLVKQHIIARAKQADKSLDAGVREATWNDLPLCYYIANNRRAIVVAPFFLPRPSANIYAGNVHNRAVQMVGFETTDFHIVETVLLEIEFRRNSIKEANTKPP